MYRTKIDFETDIKTNWNSSFVDNKIISFMHIYFTFLQAAIGWLTGWLALDWSFFIQCCCYCVLFDLILFFRLFHFRCPGWFCFFFRPERRKMVLCVFLAFRIFYYRNSQFVSSVSSFLKLASIMLEIFSLFLWYLLVWIFFCCFFCRLFGMASRLIHSLLSVA